MTAQQREKGSYISMTQVLVVDDSSTIREFVHRTLEPEGYAVCEADDGAQGLDALKSATDRMVVLLDYQMPQLDGAQVLTEVARVGTPLTNHEYYVITAAENTFPPAFIDLLRYLSIRVLPKPLEPRSLVVAVQAAAERLSAIPEKPVES